jgi:hypothetical protein
MFNLRALAAAMALGCAVHTTAASAQASQIPPGEQCFQATTGLTGMIGALGFITGGSGGVNGTYPGVSLFGAEGGTGGTATVVVSGGAVTSVTVINPGLAYFAGDNLSVTPSAIGGVTGFSVPLLSTSINSSLAGGAVGMYIPGTLTTKQTFKDAAQTMLNTNPVQLDLNGCSLMYGTGTYRQILFDRLGNKVWDQPTTVFAPNPVYAGLAAGTANAITVTDSAFSGLDGQSITFLASQTNTGATTLNPSSFGAISVVKNTSSGPVALSGGEIVGGTPGNLYTVTYSAIFSEFFLSNLIPAAASGAFVPSGAVMAFALTTCPTGWVSANGTGSTVNMLGAVARGFDPTNTRDPNGSGQSIGSFEAPMFLTHTMTSLTGSGFLNFVGTGGSIITGSGTNNVANNSTTGPPSVGAGNETRAASTILLYCQKS